MRLSKKCQYALKAVFELAMRNNAQPIKIHDIAKAQKISPRFLEVIMNELRHGSFVESRRGADGGYLLAKDAKDITIGQIIRYIQGPIEIAGENDSTASSSGDNAFQQLWQDINSAVSRVCDDKTFADLVELERNNKQNAAPNYVI